MEVLAIIPARGGSKGIPGKNIKNLCGKPLITYAIEAARSSMYVNRTIVSTDALDIAKVASQFGADVINRPEAISGDTASSESALLHALDLLAQEEGYVPDLMVFLQCTSPLTIASDIDSTIEKLISQNGDTALTVTPFHYFIWSQNADNEAVGVNHDKRTRLLRQENGEQFLESGAVYVMRVKKFLKHKHRFFGKTVCNIVPLDRCFEIDDPIDWVVAEAMIQFHNNN